MAAGRSKRRGKECARRARPAANQTERKAPSRRRAASSLLASPVSAAHVLLVCRCARYRVLVLLVVVGWLNRDKPATAKLIIHDKLSTGVVVLYYRP
jgi:hypothetical protein